MICPNCKRDLGILKKYQTKECRCGRTYIVNELKKELKLEDVTPVIKG